MLASAGFRFGASERRSVKPTSASSTQLFHLLSELATNVMFYVSFCLSFFVEVEDKNQVPVCLLLKINDLNWANRLRTNRLYKR